MSYGGLKLEMPKLLEIEEEERENGVWALSWLLIRCVFSGLEWDPLSPRSPFLLFIREKTKKVK